jgi:hypothetical protein
MCTRLFLYGDGDARETHVSICLVIFKGEYDAILTWPFIFPVNFCLHDQTGQNHHIIDSTSSNFQRPCSEMNIASGIPYFCPLEIVQQKGNCYIRDDTMFIKTMVDFTGIPREILPDILSYNPGLPSYETEAKCRMEIEQYLQLRANLVAQIIRDNQDISERILVPPLPLLQTRTRSEHLTSTTNAKGIPPEDVINVLKKRC